MCYRFTASVRRGNNIFCKNIRDRVAFKKKYDYFTTTLTISPYKDSNKLNKIGNILEKKYNVKYLYSNFKKRDGYKKSIELSKKYNLYRQNYCGCIYSKMERDVYETNK